MMSEERPPVLLISLDFELHWGVRDHFDLNHPYAKNLLGARKAIPQLLELFSEFQIAATWATVGLLFAENSVEQSLWTPRCKPAYHDTTFDAYRERVGENESADPFHFAASLIELIRRTPRQEIGSHTFSHFQCQEPGPTRADFQADLEAATGIAREKGLEIRSLAFPRNEINPDFLPILSAQGISSYRGREKTWGHHRSRGSWLGKVYRWLDSYFPLSGCNANSWRAMASSQAPYDLTGSRFLRPLSQFEVLNQLQCRRVRHSLTAAARQGGVYHLWWHPHNFGTRTAESLVHLREILTTFDKCRQDFGMVSLSMNEMVKHFTDKEVDSGLTTN